jgi:hypothetical protein
MKDFYLTIGSMRLKAYHTILFSLFLLAASAQKNIVIAVPKQPHARIVYGVKQIQTVLKKIGINSSTVYSFSNGNQKQIIVSVNSDPALQSFALKNKIILDTVSYKEGFTICSYKNTIIINGADFSGALYGCLELADEIQSQKKIPRKISVKDHPQMVMRGACIGLQKATYLPGRQVYEYPYTPETFPWFYDKALWIQYLDSMVANRMNSLYLWNGHPFASLVKIKEYPYAVEVNAATFKKNEEIFKFLTEEANKRGIWIIQMFYNIIVSKPFAEKNNLKTQDRNRPIIPIIADYTRKSIAAFVAKYPNVGLGLTLGEAMEGVGQDDIDWFTKTVIPGVLDGLKVLGTTEQPPIILRAHDTDAPTVMKFAKPLYHNLYTMAKYNGEALTTYEPRGSWAKLHQTLSSIGTVHIENVHILANLEPFRYGSADFIQKCVQAMHNIYGANGLHLYPQASYWDWPYSADSANTRLLQVERDWIWYKEWSRYAWNCNRNRNDEISYWATTLALKFGCGIEQGKQILEAYEQSGEIAPKLLRRFGITDGNRQTLTLGMLMTQLINPYRYGLFDLLYDSESPEGEKLIEYAEKEWKHQPHVGETPVQIINEVIEHGNKAVAAIEKAQFFITRDKAEFNRILNDMRCYKALANHYAQKAEASLWVLRYKYSNDVKDLDKALPYLQQSVQSYKQLVGLTKATYLYANSMQTQQRKIPIRGVNATFKTWEEVLVPFEDELNHFKHAIDSLKNNPSTTTQVNIVLQNYTVSTNQSFGYTIGDNNAKPFADTNLMITDYAKELKGLRGFQLSYQTQIKNGIAIEFTNDKPVKILVGFFNKKDTAFLKAPELETDATANDLGQADTKIANGLILKNLPPINIHSYSFPAGKNTLQLAKGACLVVGVIDANQNIPVYDAGLTEKGIKKEIDWLFE